MLMKKASGDDSPLRQGAGKSFWTLRSRDDDGGGLQYVLWKSVRCLGFSHQREFTGRRAMSGGGPGVHTTRWRGQRVARTTLWCGCPLAPLRLSFGLRLRVR
jgi:hypothetical protein